MRPHDCSETPSDHEFALKEGRRSEVVRSCRRELTLLLAVLSMTCASCATVGVRPTDAMGADILQKEKIEQVEKKPPSKGEGQGEGDSEEDPEIEDEFQEGMDEVEKCLDITLGDERRALDKAFFGKPSNKKIMKMSQVAKRCVSI